MPVPSQRAFNGKTYILDGVYTKNQAQRIAGFYKRAGSFVRVISAGRNQWAVYTRYRYLKKPRRR